MQGDVIIFWALSDRSIDKCLWSTVKKQPPFLQGVVWKELLRVSVCPLPPPTRALVPGSGGAGGGLLYREDQQPNCQPLPPYCDHPGPGPAWQGRRDRGMFNPFEGDSWPVFLGGAKWVGRSQDP